jgi:hypothetical protein
LGINNSLVYLYFLFKVMACKFSAGRINATGVGGRFDYWGWGNCPTSKITKKGLVNIFVRLDSNPLGFLSAEEVNLDDTIER